MRFAFNVASRLYRKAVSAERLQKYVDTAAAVTRPCRYQVKGDTAFFIEADGPRLAANLLGKLLNCQARRYAGLFAKLRMSTHGE